MTGTSNFRILETWFSEGQGQGKVEEGVMGHYGPFSQTPNPKWVPWTFSL